MIIISKIKNGLLGVFSLVIILSILFLVSIAAEGVFEWFLHIYLDVLGLPAIVIGDAESPKECLNVGIAQKLWFGFLTLAMYFFYLLIKKLNDIDDKVSKISQDLYRSGSDF
jgi:hypothetical protein